MQSEVHNPPLALGNNSVEDRKACYNSHTQFTVTIVYIVLILIWIATIILMKFYDSPAWFLLGIPFLVFLYALTSCHYLTYDIEDEMFKASYLSIGLILSLPLLSWMNKDYNGNKNQFVSIIFVALGFTILTYIDVWVTKKWLSVLRHFRSGMQTMAVTLFLFAIMTYYKRRLSGGLP